MVALILTPFGISLTEGTEMKHFYQPELTVCQFQYWKTLVCQVVPQAARIRLSCLMIKFPLQAGVNVTKMAPLIIPNKINSIFLHLVLQHTFYMNPLVK